MNRKSIQDPHHTTHSRTLGMLAAVLVMLVVGQAVADPSAADKESARALWLDGRAKFKAGDYASALKSFQAAHAIMGVPTTGIELARAQAALGLLIEARETALDVTRQALKPGEPEPYARARVEAVELADDLDKRIPSLRIAVGGAAPGAKVRLTVDGSAIPEATNGLPRRVNPGRHEVVAKAPHHVPARQIVIAAAGRVTDVEIVFRPQPTGAVEPLASAPTPVPPPPIESPSSPGSGRRVAGYTVGAAGVVGLGVGIGLGLLAKSKRDASNADNHCDAANTCDDIGLGLRQDAILAARGSTAAFVLGGIALAGGVVLVATAPSPKVSSSIASGFGVSPGGASWFVRW